MINFKKITAAFSAAIVTAACASSLAASAVESASEAPFTAWLSMSAGGFGYGGNSEEGTPDNDTALTMPTIEEDGTYEASITIPSGQGSASIECLYLSTNINGYAYTKSGGDILKDTVISLTVDSITLTHADGTSSDIAYNGPSDNAFAKENNGTDYRVNIYNTWGTSVKDINNDLSASPMGDGDTLTVKFTITGLADSPFNVALGDVDGNEKVEMIDAYNVLMESSILSAGGDPTFTEEQKTAADIDGNGKIEMIDAYYVLLYSSYISAGGNPTWEQVMAG